MISPIQALARNIFSNWALTLTTIAIAFFMNPFLVHNLGKEQYGIWALVLSVVAYTGFLDAGLRQSLARYIPKYYAVKDYEGLNTVLNSSNVVYTASGSLVIVVTVLIALFLVGVFNVAPELVRVMQIVLMVVGLNQAVRFYFLTSASLGPFHRYDVGNAIDVTAAIVTALVIVFFIRRGYGLVAMAVITLAVSFLQFVARRVAQKRIVPEVAYRLSYVSKSCIRELLGYGIISFLIVIAWMVIFNTQNVVIGIFLTSTDVTYYSIAGMMINYLRTMIGAIAIPLVPAISHLDTTSNLKEIAALFNRLSNYLYYLCTGIGVAVLFFGGQFIYLWMGRDFQVTVNVLWILIVPACVYLPQFMANSVLLGISRHKPLLYVLTAEAVGNIVLSVILVKPLGVYGVALGTIIPQFIIYAFVFPYVFHRIIQGSLRSFYYNSGKMALTALVFTVPPAFLTREYLPAWGWFGLVAKVAVLCAALLLGFWWRVLDRDTRAGLAARLPAFLRTRQR
ncbi:MAG TPA: oligosaccharide flippase family protein [Acidobacteriota bacterium]|nr:oligosaccharide flippase family protein [Acidobacteriota bacterium]